MTAITYAVPTPQFSDDVSVFYLIETKDAKVEILEAAGLAQLQFILRGAASIRPISGIKTDLAEIGLIGPRNSAAYLTMHGPLQIFGIGLRPQGWLATAKRPASIFADQAGDGRALACGPIGQAHARISEAQTFRDMIKIAEKYLAIVARSAAMPPISVIHAIEDWLMNSPNPKIADLLAHSGLSETQAQRHCKALFGAPPKLLARKYRALRMARQIAQGQCDWQLQADRVFYDQSHCIRELRHFIGLTPSAIHTSARLLPAHSASADPKGWPVDLWIEP
jgi:AraC-like DNA-binding protein